MLHAANRRKTSYWNRYVGFRHESEKRVQAEDELTSTLLGPLAFMQPEAIGAFWMSVIRCHAEADPFPPGTVVEARMEFWPTRDKREPDLRVDLQWPLERRIILVELKWESSLSPADQLQLQWEDCVWPDEKLDALHLFVGKDISAAEIARKNHDVWKGRLYLRSWFDILNILKRLDGAGAKLLLPWADQVKGLLELLGIRPFEGFTRLTPPFVPTSFEQTFWSEFEGFARLKGPRVLQGRQAVIFTKD